jgi:hypothetical protein
MSKFYQWQTRYGKVNEHTCSGAVTFANGSAPIASRLARSVALKYTPIVSASVECPRTASGAPSYARIFSPRLVHPEQSADFVI